MKKVLLFSTLFCAIALPTLGELTEADLNKIRLIVNNSENSLKEHTSNEVITSENRMKGHIKDQIDGVNSSISAFKWVIGFFMAFIAILIASIGIPSWRGKKVREQEERIEGLAEEIKELRQQYAILTGSGL